MSNIHKVEPAPLAAVAPEAAAAPAAASAGKTPPNYKALGVVGLIALLALGAGGRMWYRAAHFVETENAYVAGHVTPVSPRIAGIITKVLVKDNQVVKAGDVIAELDPADQQVKVEQIEAQIASAEQQVLQAGATVAQVKAQAGAAGAQVAQSEAQLVRAKQDAERYGQLYNTQMKAVSKAELDAATAARNGATADLAAKRGNVGAAEAQIAAATSAQSVAKAQVKVLQAQLKDARQQLAAIVQDEIWVTANFKETQLEKLQPGQAVKVVIDAMPGTPLVGHVESFSPASGNQFALLPADNATGNFTKIVQRVPVKIVFADADLKKMNGRLVPGMSALAEVELDSTKTAAAH